MTRNEYEIYKDGLNRQDVLINQMFRLLSMQERRAYVDMLVDESLEKFIAARELSGFSFRSTGLPLIIARDTKCSMYTHVIGKPGRHILYSCSEMRVTLEIFIGHRFNIIVATNVAYDVNDVRSGPVIFRKDSVYHFGEGVRKRRRSIYKKLNSKLIVLRAHITELKNKIRSMKLKPPLGVKVNIEERWTQQIKKHLRRFLYKIVEL